MKMKRTLIAIAVVALLATSVQAGSYSIWDPYYFTVTDHHAVKVDGTESKEFRWPYTISYQSLKVCNIPIKMKVGMFVQVENCAKLKIILEQVDCGDIDKGNNYPCYLGCVKFKVRANFPVKMGHSLNKGDIIPDSAAYYHGDTVIPDDGEWKEVELCVKAWKAKIYDAKPGNSVDAGSVDVTVKPNV
jgi:hypothetical protein